MPLPRVRSRIWMPVIGMDLLPLVWWLLLSLRILNRTWMVIIASAGVILFFWGLIELRLRTWSWMAVIAMMTLPLVWRDYVSREIGAQQEEARRIRHWVRRSAHPNRINGARGHWGVVRSFPVPWSEGTTELTTSAGKSITIETSLGGWPGCRVKRLSISSSTRTLEISPELIERGELIDLKDLFPEAF